MKTTEKIKTRQADTMIEIEVTTRPAVVDFNDILDACEIEPDEYAEMPWNDCDGFEHTNHNNRATWGYSFPSLPEEADKDEMRGYWSSVHNGDRGVITVDREHATREQWGAGFTGCSKQVMAEMIAQNIGTTIDYLIKWYEGRESMWYVRCDYEGYSDSIGSVDDYEHARTFWCPEIASNIAHQMKADGYTIENEPQRTNGATREDKRARLKYNLTLDCWKTYKYHTTTRAKRLPRLIKKAA